MELLVMKLVFLAVCFLITATLGTLPIHLFEYFRAKVHENRFFHAFVDFLNCFSGGVFLATCLLHLLPETRMHFLQAIYTGKLFSGSMKIRKKKISVASLDDTAYPYPELIALCGFFFIYLLESVVFQCMGNDPTKYSLLLDDSTATDVVPHSTTDYGTSELSDSTPLKPRPKGKSRERCLKSWADVQSVTLVVALCVNSVIEGVALGISLDASHLAIRFVGVMCHKVLVAFVTGLQCAQGTLGRCRATVLILTYCLMTPSGLAVGTVLTEASGLEGELARSYAIFILEGLSSGSFLYITFFEILGRARETRNSSPLVQLCATFAGFAPMAGLISLIN